MNAARLKRMLPYALLGAGAGYLYYVAANIDYVRRAGTLGPDFWPRVILLLLIAVCAVAMIRIAIAREPGRDVAGVLEAIAAETAREHGAAPAPAPPAANHPLILAGGIALTALYVATVATLGFVTGSAAYLAAFIVLGGYRRPAVVAAVSLGGTLLLFFFFVKVVYVSLPLGTGPFQRVTLILMSLLGVR
ncbi:MAG: tripartite tricarboxylate transporter TctB family protein [Burkholderiales bacterium]|nr:tripartite tricarboxylate transporter TctB family protein [Burkholderiales bacterium]